MPWTVPEQIAVAPPGSGRPALAAVGETLHLVFNHNKSLYHSINTAGRWTVPVRVAQGTQATLQVTPFGSLHCLFSNEFAGNFEVYHVVWDGKAWSLPRNISRTSGASTHPSLATGSDGSLYAVWADTTPGYSVVYHAEKGELLWSSAPLPNGRGVLPTVTVASNGDLYIAWQDRVDDTDRYDTYCAVLKNGTWSVAENVSDTATKHSVSIHLVVTSGNTCHALWQEEDNGTYQIYYSDRRPNGWSQPLRVSAPAVDCRLPRAVANPRGYIQALWLEGSLLLHRLRPSQYDATWKGPESVPGSWPDAGDLTLALTTAGQLNAVWSSSYEGGDRMLYYARRRPVFQHTVHIPGIGR